MGRAGRGKAWRGRAGWGEAGWGRAGWGEAGKGGRGGEGPERGTAARSGSARGRLSFDFQIEKQKCPVRLFGSTNAVNPM